MNSTLLKPCPFCGCENILIKSRKTVIIECGQCEALVVRQDIFNAVTTWNKRPEPGPRVILEGWRIERVDTPPFQRIVFVTPHGYSSVADSLGTNPENVLYLLGAALLKEAEK